MVAMPRVLFATFHAGVEVAAGIAEAAAERAIVERTSALARIFEGCDRSPLAGWHPSVLGHFGGLSASMLGLGQGGLGSSEHRLLPLPASAILAGLGRELGGGVVQLLEHSFAAPGRCGGCLLTCLLELV